MAKPTIRISRALISSFVCRGRIFISTFRQSRNGVVLLLVQLFRLRRATLCF
jgi:hypothetical protein